MAVFFSALGSILLEQEFSLLGTLLMSLPLKLLKNDHLCRFGYKEATHKICVGYVLTQKVPF